MFHKNASFINPLVEKKLTLNQEISDTYCPVYICTTKSTTSLQTTTTTTTSITTNTAATTTTTAKSTTSFTPTTTAISRPIEHEYIYVICFLSVIIVLLILLVVYISKSKRRVVNEIERIPLLNFRENMDEIELN